MKRIFVYEHLTAVGALDAAEDADAALRAMGRSMRDAVAADLLALGVYDVSVAGPGTGAHAADPVPQGAQAVVPRAGESVLDFVARQADSHSHAWVIAPETGGVLAQLQRVVDPGRWLGCTAAAIALASGKRATLTRLADAGVTTPLAFEHDAEITRWVVKPDDGAGAVDTRVHTDLEAALRDASARSRPGTPMAIEPWVDGPALSLSLMCRPGACELLSVNRQHIVVGAAGDVSFRGVEVNVLPIGPARAGQRNATPDAAATLRSFAERIASAIPGLRGFVGIDLVWHAQRGPVAIEVNPRVTCAYVGLSQALGRNLGAAVLAAAGAHDGPAHTHG